SGMHARARGALIEDHELFALFEAPQRRGQCADIHGLSRNIEEMRQKSSDLAVKHTDQLTAFGHFDAEEPLGRQRKGMLLIHRRDIIEPIEVWHRLQVSLVLDELLGAAMEEPDMRIDAGHYLAVEAQHETKHAM